MLLTCLLLVSIRSLGKKTWGRFQKTELFLDIEGIWCVTVEKKWIDNEDIYFQEIKDVFEVHIIFNNKEKAIIYLLETDYKTLLLKIEEKRRNNGNTNKTDISKSTF